MTADVVVKPILDGLMHLVSLESEAAKTWCDDNTSIHPEAWWGLESFGLKAHETPGWVRIMREAGLVVVEPAP